MKLILTVGLSLLFYSNVMSIDNDTNAWVFEDGELLNYSVSVGITSKSSESPFVFSICNGTAEYKLPKDFLASKKLSIGFEFKRFKVNFSNLDSSFLSKSFTLRVYNRPIKEGYVEAELKALEEFFKKETGKSIKYDFYATLSSYEGREFATAGNYQKDLEKSR